MGFASLLPRSFLPKFYLGRLVRATAPSQKRPIKLALVVPIMMSWTHRLTGPSPSNSAHGISLELDMNYMSIRSIHGSFKCHQKNTSNKTDWKFVDNYRWKNNVERKNKFMLLQRDAAYDESDEKQVAR